MTMKRHITWIASLGLVVLMADATLFADRVKLRSGKSVDGSFLSADVKVVRVLLGNGSIAEFKVEDIASVEFTPRKQPPPPPPPPPPTAAAAAPPTPRPGAEAVPHPRQHRAERAAHAGDRRRLDQDRCHLQVHPRRPRDAGWQSGHPA